MPHDPPSRPPEVRLHMRTGSASIHLITHHTLPNFSFWSSRTGACVKMFRLGAARLGRLRPRAAPCLISSVTTDAPSAPASSSGPPAGSAQLLRQRVPGRGWQALWLDSETETGVACEGTGPFRRRRPPGSAGSAPMTTSEAMADWALRSIAIGFLPSGALRTVGCTVHDNYMTYVRWTAVSLLSGKMQAVLATQATLFAVGLGAGSIPMAAAVQWVLKDGFGHGGAIVYAALVNTKFDADAKRYRFHATCALTVADAMAAGLPLVPQHFLLLASISSAVGSIANLAHVAARARVMASFAKVGNLADCVRAGQTQSKLMSLGGTGLGAALSWIVGPEPYHVMACMVPLALTSLYSAHQSSSLVVLPSLNVQRAERVFASMLLDLDRELAEGSGRHEAPLAAPTPAEVAAVETFVAPYASVLPGELLLQPLFREGFLPAWAPGWAAGAGSGSCPLLHAVLPLLRAQAGAEGAERPHASGGAASGGWRASWHGAYALAVRDGVTAVGEAGAAGAGGAVALWYGTHASAADKLRAVWHASLLRRGPVAAGRCEATLAADDDAAAALAAATWPRAHAALERAGWDLGTLYLDGDGGSLKLAGTR